MASVGGDVAGNDRDDFGVDARGPHTTNGTCRSRSSRSSQNWTLPCAHRVIDPPFKVDDSIVPEETVHSGGTSRPSGSDPWWLESNAEGGHFHGQRVIGQLDQFDAV